MCGIRAMRRRARIIELVGVCWRRSAFVVVALVRGSSRFTKVCDRKSKRHHAALGCRNGKIAEAGRTLGEFDPSSRFRNFDFCGKTKSRSTKRGRGETVSRDPRPDEAMGTWVRQLKTTLQVLQVLSKWQIENRGSLAPEGCLSICICLSNRTSA